MLVGVALVVASLVSQSAGSLPPCVDGADECNPWDRDWDNQAARQSAQPNFFDQFDEPRRLTGEALKQPIIPLPFRGEWNEDLSACGTARNDSRLRITGTNIAFYESDGEVKRVILHNSRAITVRASFAGEGQVWDADQQLVLSRSGNDLTINKEGSTFTRHRCP